VRHHTIVSLRFALAIKSCSCAGIGTDSHSGKKWKPASAEREVFRDPRKEIVEGKFTSFVKTIFTFAPKFNNMSAGRPSFFPLHLDQKCSRVQIDFPRQTFRVLSRATPARRGCNRSVM
jgi:hypothetical protein